jgi:aspartate/methionine/tyrosine aminotransferase
MSAPDIRDAFILYWRELARHSDSFDFGMGMPPPDFFAPWLTVHKDLVRGLAERANYQPQTGYWYLREALAHYESVRTGFPCAPGNIMLVSGAIRGFSLVLDCLANSATTLVELVPTYPLLAGHARDVAQRTGCELITIIPSDQSNFEVHEQEVLSAIKPGGILYLTDPSNPTGRYTPPHILSACAATCEQIGALMIVDQSCDLPFQYLLERYDWVSSPSVIRLRSFSKDLLLAGFRIGYLVADPDLITLFSRHYALSDGNAPLVTNAAIEHFVGKPEVLPHLSSIAHSKVQRAVEQLTQSQQIRHIITPEASYYLFLQLDYHRGSWEFFEYCLSNGMNVMPGSLFGVPGEAPWIRICCARNDDDLSFGLDKLSQIIANF